MSSPARQVYDRLAPFYDQRWHAYEEATLNAVLAVLDGRPGQLLLDVGCGTGELERWLQARCPHL